MKPTEAIAIVRSFGALARVTALRSSSVIRRRDVSRDGGRMVRLAGGRTSAKTLPMNSAPPKASNNHTRRSGPPNMRCRRYRPIVACTFASPPFPALSGIPHGPPANPTTARISESLDAKRASGMPDRWCGMPEPRPPTLANPNHLPAPGPPDGRRRSGRGAAVDGEDFASDERTGVADEEQRRSDDLARVTDAPERGRRCDVGEYPVVERLRHHVGPERSG